MPFSKIERKTTKSKFKYTITMVLKQNDTVLSVFNSKKTSKFAANKAVLLGLKLKTAHLDFNPVPLFYNAYS